MASGVRLQDQPVDAVEQGLVVGAMRRCSPVRRHPSSHYEGQARCVGVRLGRRAASLAPPRGAHRVRRQLQTAAHSGRFCSQPHILPHKACNVDRSIHTSGSTRLTGGAAAQAVGLLRPVSSQGRTAGLCAFWSTRRLESWLFRWPPAAQMSSCRRSAMTLASSRRLSSPEVAWLRSRSKTSR